MVITRKSSYRKQDLLKAARQLFKRADGGLVGPGGILGPGYKPSAPAIPAPAVATATGQSQEPWINRALSSAGLYPKPPEGHASWDAYNASQPRPTSPPAYLASKGLKQLGSRVVQDPDYNAGDMLLPMLAVGGLKASPAASGRTLAGAGSAVLGPTVANFKKAPLATAASTAGKVVGPAVSAGIVDSMFNEGNAIVKPVGNALGDLTRGKARPHPFDISKLTPELKAQAELQAQYDMDELDASQQWRPGERAQIEKQILNKHLRQAATTAKHAPPAAAQLPEGVPAPPANYEPEPGGVVQGPINGWTQPPEPGGIVRDPPFSLSPQDTARIFGPRYANGQPIPRPEDANLAPGPDVNKLPSGRDAFEGEAGATKLPGYVPAEQRAQLEQQIPQLQGPQQQQAVQKVVGSHLADAATELFPDAAPHEAIGKLTGQLDKVMSGAPMPPPLLERGITNAAKAAGVDINSLPPPETPLPPGTPPPKLQPPAQPAGPPTPEGYQPAPQTPFIGAPESITGGPPTDGSQPTPMQTVGDWFHSLITQYQGLDTLHQVMLAVGVPLAIGGLAYSLLGNGGWGGIAAGLLGAGAAAYGTGQFDDLVHPLVQKALNWAGVGGSTQPNSGAAQANTAIPAAATVASAPPVPTTNPTTNPTTPDRYPMRQPLSPIPALGQRPAQAQPPPTGAAMPSPANAAAAAPAVKPPAAQQARPNAATKPSAPAQPIVAPPQLVKDVPFLKKWVDAGHGKGSVPGQLDPTDLEPIVKAWATPFGGVSDTQVRQALTRLKQLDPAMAAQAKQELTAKIQQLQAAPGSLEARFGIPKLQLALGWL